ncbi:hypothetical protein [Maritimibacter alexandrii]|uniref:hypothetical protein n=1 Tax=Maritimibacter alexandrii TaxID=2570355 RepID=UPI001108BAD9|nr:hypothetical protein [Maritimibacter alexandrii]
MRKILLVVLTCSWSQSAISQADANPDAGKLMRLVCYGVSKPGAKETRKPDLVIVITQLSSDKVDASYLVPGNANFSEKYPAEQHFELKEFRDPAENNYSTDPTELSEHLLNTEAAATLKVFGGRTRNDFVWDLNGEDNPGGALFWYPNNMTGSSYRTRGDIPFHSSIICFDPFGVESVSD